MPEVRGLLPEVKLVDKPEAGSPGMKNPDVARYDPSGLRSAMTTNWAALQKGLAAARPTHNVTPFWAKPGGYDAEVGAKLAAQGLATPGLPKARRLKGWEASHAAEW